MQIYYAFIGTLLAFAFRDVLEILFDLRQIRKIKLQQAQHEADRNLPKPNTANKGRIQR